MPIGVATSRSTYYLILETQALAGEQASVGSGTGAWTGVTEKVGTYWLCMKTNKVANLA